MKDTKSSRNALHVATLSGWYRFEQSSSEWREAGRALPYWSLTCLSVDAEKPTLVYAGSEHSGLFYTTDGGKRWLRAKPNVPKLMLFSVLAVSGTVMAGTIPAALYQSAGDGWQELEGVRLASSGATFPPSPELQSRTRYLAAEPDNPSRLYAGIEVGGLLISDDGGKTWRAVSDGLTDLDVHEVLPCENTAGLVLAACGDKAFRSRDRGARWEEITPASHDYGMSLGEDAEGAVYLGSAKGRPNTWLRESGADAAIFRSANGGGKWETVIEGLHGGVMSMCRAPDGVIAGTSDGELIAVDAAGARVVARELPCITAIAMGG